MVVYYKMWQILLQNAIAFYYKMRQFCYKIQQLLNNTTLLLQNMQNMTVSTKCVSTAFDFCLDLYLHIDNYDIIYECFASRII